MKLRMPKSFNINKWLEKLEIPARALIWPFVMILAILTVVPNISNLTELTGLILLIYLILFFFATTIVFLIDVRPLSRRQPSNQRRKTEIPAYEEHPGRNRWISIGVLVLVVIIVVLIFVARQLPATTQGYQAFFTAFAAIAALGTGIALTVFAYQQYKLRQTEHGLLFEPQVTLSFGNILTKGTTRGSFQREPYTIEFTVMIQNSTQLPVLIEHIQMDVTVDGDESGRRTPIPPMYFSFLETAYSDLPFQVTLPTPRRVKWIMSGSLAGDPFDYVSGESGKRNFRFIFRVFGKIPKGPRESTFFKEVTSWPIHVPKDANWVSKTPFPDNLKRN